MPAITAPRELLRALELPRTAFELGSLFASAAYLQLVKRGDGHPVMVLPGFGGGDDSTVMLRRYLTSIGYDARPWNLGRNMGLRHAGGIDDLHGELDRIHRERGKTVSLIGWSLGGVHARNLAKRAPGPGAPGDHARQSVWPKSPRAASVPCTAIYSRSDGIVAWQSAMEEPGPMTDNIEVYGSHLGLGFNPAVYYAIADRLAQPHGTFERFSRAGWRSAVYGPAHSARARD